LGHIIPPKFLEDLRNASGRKNWEKEQNAFS
jgi:hypothetical protein